MTSISRPPLGAVITQQQREAHFPQLQELPFGVPVATLNPVRITYDPPKREKTLRRRGLDFEDAPAVFAGVTISVEDTRRDYGEERTITAGHLAGRCVVLVWTPRDGTRRIMSMRHAHADEEHAWFGGVG